MSQPFVGEIRMFGGNFAPAGWAICDGSLLAISQNDVLFQLIGTTYGGDGQNTFALPDLRSRIPVHQGPGFVLGQSGGAETVTLTESQLPAHDHIPLASSAAGSSHDPTGNVWANWTGSQYTDQAPNGLMSPAAVSLAGAAQSHDNMAPFLDINFIISLFGVFPSQG
jgi:microcystin-dependent protein